MTRDVLGYAAQQQTIEAGLAVRSHHDQVGGPCRGTVQNDPARFSLSNRRTRREPSVLQLSCGTGDKGDSVTNRRIPQLSIGVRDLRASFKLQ
jgi:hypothetical protein